MLTHIFKLFLKDYFYYVLETKTGEGEQNNIHLLPPTHPLPGIEPLTQARALTGS